MSRLIEVKQIPAHVALSCTRVVTQSEIGDFIRQSIDTLFAFTNKQGGEIVGAPRAIYHQPLDEVKGGLVEVCLPVTGVEQAPPEASLKEQPGTKVATTIVTLAESEKMGPIYDAVYRWLNEQGYKASGSVQELYLSPRPQTGPDDPYIQIALPIG